MPSAPARDRQVFAPQPISIAVWIDGALVETDVYDWQDLPVKDSLEVCAIEDEMRTHTGGWPELIELMLQAVRRLAPRLDQRQLEALTPRQLQQVLSVSHGVPPDRPREAGADGASPSASASSTTPAPPASAGGPPTSTG